MDYEYWLRLGIKQVRFAYLQEKLAGSRLYADNKALGAQVKVHKEINDMLKTVFGRVPDRRLLNYAHVVGHIKIDRKKSPRMYITQLLVLIFVTALRWNGQLFRDMIIILDQIAKVEFYSRIK